MTEPSEELAQSIARCAASGAPGKLLAAAHVAVKTLGDRAGDAAPGIARAFECDEATVRAAILFRQQLSELPADVPVRVCAGVNCRRRGARRFLELMTAIVAESEPGRPVLEPTCLEECGFGPNVAIGRSIFRAGDGQVVKDEQPWR